MTSWLDLVVGLALGFGGFVLGAVVTLVAVVTRFISGMLR